MKTFKLGMPHLNYHGLHHVWLAKHLGQKHWDMLSNGPALSKDNQRLYASFFCCHLDFNQGQHFYHENDYVKIEGKLFKYNSQIYRSMHTVSNDANLTTAIFDSIFVRKNLETNKLVRDDPMYNVNEILHTDKVFIDEHKKLKKELRDTELTQNLVNLQYSPDTYFNAVKILYFANYLNLVSQCEFLCFPMLKDPIKKLTIYYFGNIDVGDKISGVTTQQDNIWSTKLITNGKAIALCNITR